MSAEPRVIVLDSDPAPLLERLAEAMPDVQAEGCDSYAGMEALVAGFRPDVVYSVTFAGRAGYPRAALYGADGPAWISVGGSGVDHLESWDPARITVTNSAGVASAMMAEYVFGMFLRHTLDLAGLARDQAERRWDATRLMRPLQGKTLLIVGLGHTGQEVARRAKAFDMTVIGTRSRPRETENVDEVHASADLGSLWGRADFVVLCVPLLASTRGLVDAAAFAAMKPDAVLVDVSRGGVIDHDALLAALRRRAISFAALDVFPEEPLPEDSPLWGLDNLSISPHASAVFDGWAMRSFEMFLDNLRRFRAGDPLHNVVDPARGY